MEPKLLSNETFIKKIEAGPRDFIFTDKRLIVQNTDGQDSRYTGFDSISRPVLTPQTLSDPFVPEAMRLFGLSYFTLVVLFCLYYLVTRGFMEMISAMFVGIFYFLPVGLVIGVVIALLTRKKAKEVVLFQLLMKDGTMLINEYYEPVTKNVLTEIEYSIVERTLN